MKIALIVEGKTEKAFLRYLCKFLRPRLETMPNIDAVPYNGRIPTAAKLERVVSMLLSGPRAADHVVALTDVYTGSPQPEFVDARDAKSKMRHWVGDEPRFHPHAAQHDFEAWLLPYWATIQSIARHNRTRPAGNPERVNHNNPPAHRISEIFEVGHCRRSYIKPRDASRILHDNDLIISIRECSELKELVNTFLRLSGGTVIP